MMRTENRNVSDPFGNGDRPGHEKVGADETAHSCNADASQDDIQYGLWRIRKTSKPDLDFKKKGNGK